MNVLLGMLKLLNVYKHRYTYVYVRASVCVCVCACVRVCTQLVFCLKSNSLYYIINLFYSQSASCVRVCGLLHALVAMNPVPFHTQRTDDLLDEEEVPLPITSYACQWKIPRKQKESTLMMSDTTFRSTPMINRKHALFNQWRMLTLAQ